MALRKTAWDDLKYHRRVAGVCQDCGHCHPVRQRTFWLNGFQIQLCAHCEHVYAKVLLHGS